MIGRIMWTPTRAKEIPNGNYSKLRENRVGICLHYDASGSDAGAVAWFGDPRCRVSYQLLVLDNGSFVRIAPDDKRAWHAGRCKTSDPERLKYKDANSALYGIAIASSGKHGVEPLQLLTTAFLVRRYFELRGWDITETWRIVGHNTEATPRGRKTDPEGADPKNPILSVDHIRQLVPHVEVPAMSSSLEEVL